jgi:urease accessory protein
MARNEAHVYDLYWAETEVRDSGGALLFADTLRLRPGEIDDPTSPGVLGGYDIVASLYVVSATKPPAELVAELRQALSGEPDIIAGVSELPAGRGASVRLFGYSSQAVQAAMKAAWNRARCLLLSAAAPDLRKG